MAFRKTRIVCVSDTHAYTPREAGYNLPAGDVLIHAGDITNRGSLAELRRSIEWILDADYEAKILVAGNHDVTLDPTFHAKHGPPDHNQEQEECVQLIKEASSSIIYLNHSSTTVRLARPDGPGTMFKVFGSPYSRFEGHWAFGYELAEAQDLWAQIPLDADIVVTHSPPQFHCDRRDDASLGCPELRRALSRVRPMLAVCGHIHEGRGYERVRWSTSSSPGDSLEEQSVSGSLPPTGSKKQSLVDLTGKKQARLDNVSFLERENQTSQDSLAAPLTTSSIPDAQSNVSESMQDNRQLAEPDCGVTGVDVSARKETCIVNAAIMASSWPYKTGKIFNAPIVVDLKLPVWNKLQQGN